MLRAFRERFKAQDWFGVGVELLIVAIGVFLGMQVSNWNDARVEHERGQAYRAQIEADIQTNERELSILSNYYGQVRQHALAAFTALDSRPSPADAQFVIDAFQATQILPRPLTRSGFDEARSAGAFEDVGSAEQRRLISDYYLSLDSISASTGHTMPYRELVRSRVPAIVQEKVQAACGDRSDMNRFTTVLPASCTPGLTAAEAAQSALAVRDTPGIRDALTRQISELDQDLRLMPLLGETAHRLAQRLS
jgi:hypothetical protein